MKVTMLLSTLKRCNAGGWVDLYLLGIDGTIQMSFVGLIFVVILTEKETGPQVVPSLAQ